MSVHLLDRLRISDSINLSADYATESGIFFTSLLLNGQEFVPEEIVDYEDDSYDIVFNAVDNPIYLDPGDILTFRFFEEPVPTYIYMNNMR
ncbi:MAG: hypothetical protein AAGA80_28310 [Cyanobacteria bacterium P01_F01_bin.143]